MVEQLIDQHLRMIECSFKSVEPDARLRAHATVDALFERLAGLDACEAVTKATPLASVLEVRHANQLESCGIRTVGQLINYSRTQLTEIPRLQGRTADIIEETLERHGFRLRR